MYQRKKRPFKLNQNFLINLNYTTILEYRNMSSSPSTIPLYYDKVLYQKFHPLYTLFALFHLIAIIFFVRRHFKNQEKVVFLPVLFFALRIIDLLYHFGPDYGEVEVLTSNLAIIPFSILVAKYLSFLPRYNDFPIPNNTGKHGFGPKEIKQYLSTIKVQFDKTLTPLFLFNITLLLIMALGITNVYITNLFFCIACAVSFVNLLFITLEVRLVKDTRTKANLIVSNLFLLVLYFGFKLILPWRLYSDTLYSLFFSIQYLVEISTVFLISHVMTNLMLIKYIVYV